MTIFTQGEFVRIKSGSFTRLVDYKEKVVGNVGQIHRVGDIDSGDRPYVVITVVEDETITFMANKDELILLEKNQADEEISKYLRKVKR